MCPLTTTSRTRRKVAVTREAKEVDAVIFAMRVADERLPDRLMQELAFGNSSPKQWLPGDLRARTEKELDAIASHGARQQLQVLRRLSAEGNLRKIEGTGWIAIMSGNVEMIWTPTLDGPRQMVDYGLALLLDKSKPWGSRFFRCQLESCRRFFLTAPPKGKGQYRYKYCSAEHQRDADALKVADRVRRFRERRRKS